VQVGAAGEAAGEVEEVAAGEAAGEVAAGEARVVERAPVAAPKRMSRAAASSHQFA